MSRRNRANRRRTYGKRQHEVRERRPGDSPQGDGENPGENWITPELMDDRGRREATYDAYDTEGWAR
ncbi:MAG TPA: hypothetical protein VIF08_01520 [Candidatus Limnocylindrales bacterium]